MWTLGKGATEAENVTTIDGFFPDILRMAFIIIVGVVCSFHIANIKISLPG